jgi:RteC protein
LIISSVAFIVRTRIISIILNFKIGWNLLNKFYSDLIKGMEHELDNISADGVDRINKLEHSITVTRKYLNEMRKHIEGYVFKNQNEEIHFFKNVKPHICGRHIYYIKVYKVESKRPIGTLKAQRKHFAHALNKLQLFYNDNLEFHLYYRKNSTHWDDKYFISIKSENPPHTNTIYGFWDDRLYSSHDYTVAMIKANDMLRVYLKTELKELKAAKDTKQADEEYKDSVTWTDSKVSLVELIYAIHEVGSINKGTYDIKDLTALIEKTFQIDLGDYYHTYLELKTRSNPTKYIDSLRLALLKKIEEE